MADTVLGGAPLGGGRPFRPPGGSTLSIVGR